MPYWDTGPGTQSLLWILCSKEAASSQKRHQRTRWGKVWSGCLQVYVFSCWAHVWRKSSSTTEEFTCCFGSFSHPGQVRPADLSTFSVPIPLSFLQRWVLPMCNTFKAVSMQKPTKQRKCWVCLTAVCDSPYLVDILLEIPISNFPTCLLWTQVCIYSKLVLCMHKTKINIEFCIHGVETQDFLMHPFGKDHIQKGGTSSRYPGQKGSIILGSAQPSEAMYLVWKGSVTRQGCITRTKSAMSISWLLSHYVCGLTAGLTQRSSTSHLHKQLLTSLPKLLKSASSLQLDNHEHTCMLGDFRC